MVTLHLVLSSITEKYKRTASIRTMLATPLNGHRTCCYQLLCIFSERSRGCTTHKDLISIAASLST